MADERWPVGKRQEVQTWRVQALSVGLAEVGRSADTGLMDAFMGTGLGVARVVAIDRRWNAVEWRIVWTRSCTRV